MSYAKVEGGRITRKGSRLPNADRRLSDRRWITPLKSEWTDEQMSLCGWQRITQTECPDPTYERRIELVDGKPTEVWRPYDIITLQGPSIPS